MNNHITDLLDRSIASRSHLSENFGQGSPEPPFTNKGGSQNLEDYQPQHFQGGSEENQKGGSHIPPVQVHLDWFSATFKAPDGCWSGGEVDYPLIEKVISNRLHDCDFVDWESEKKAPRVKGYDFSRSTFSGGLVAFHKRLASQGIYLSFGGQAIAYLADVHGHDGMLDKFKALQVKCTRADLAFDLHLPEVVDLAELRTALGSRSAFSGLFISPTVKPDGTDHDAKTVYFGSEQSDRRIKIYDKSSETGDWSKGFWVRVEITLKNDPASFFWLQVCTGGNFEALSRGVLRDMVYRCDAWWWPYLLDGPISAWVPLGRKQTSKRRQWLLSIIKAIQETVIETVSQGDTLLLSMFAHIVSDARKMAIELGLVKVNFVDVLRVTYADGTQQIEYKNGLCA